VVNCPALLLYSLLGLLAQTLALRAEQLLSLPEAQKLCFTNATRFDEVKVRLTRDDIKSIEAAAGAKVKNPEPRVWSAWQNAKPLGTVWFDQVIGKHELIDYVVAISTDGKVAQVEIVEYREHYGGQVRGRTWLDQFKGKAKQDSLKLGSDIHNISGATMSCRHVTEGVKRVLATFQQVRSRVPGAGGAGLSDQP
jgi:H+/Na+-translocating ferredoxin:NAD+ oxidoreductase subunit G